MRMVSTSDVLDRHLKSFAEYDLDGVLADYSSDAVLFVPDRAIKRSRRDQAPLSGPRFGVCKAGLLVHDAAAMR